MGDSVSYAIGDGIALITTRKVVEQDSLTDYYYIRSEAQVSDVFSESTPATRVVAAYAVHHRRPLAHHAALIVTANNLEVDGGEVNGADSAIVSDCPGGGAASITGGIARVDVDTSNGGTLLGSPISELWSGGSAAVYDSVGLRWDVLSDPDFPVDIEQDPTPLASLPADSFPIVRYNGNLFANGSWDGRGVLIVTGQFDSGPNHDWSGIILAGWIDDIMQGSVDGLVVGGLATNSPYTMVDWLGRMRYYSCDVYSANESLSYLELTENTVFEVN